MSNAGAMSDANNVRDVRELAPKANPAADGKAPDGDLLTWASLDLFASATVMFAAFASRSLRRASADRLDRHEAIGAKQ